MNRKEKGHMKRLSSRDTILFMAGMLLLLLPVVTRAQSGGPPPTERRVFGPAAHEGETIHPSASGGSMRR